MRAVENAGRQGARAAQAGRQGQSVRYVPGTASRSRSSVRSINGATRRKRSARRCSSQSMARPRCRPRSASIRSPTPSRRREMDAGAPRAPAGPHRGAEIEDRPGGLREAAIRALLYVGSARGMVDERSLEALRRLRAGGRVGADHAGGVQDAGARAVLHAAARPGSRACGHSQAAA